MRMTQDLTDSILARVTDEQVLALEQAAIRIPSTTFEEQRIADLFDAEDADQLLGSSGGTTEVPTDASLAALVAKAHAKLDDVVDEDRAELIDRTGPVHLGEDADQLVAAASSLEPIQVGGELSELHPAHVNQQEHQPSSECVR